MILSGHDFVFAGSSVAALRFSRLCGVAPAALRSPMFLPYHFPAKSYCFEQWHTELNPQRQAAVLREVFGGVA
jgi:hypothetical protein